MWARMPDSHIDITDDVQAYIVDGKTIMCRAVNHPAGGLSWRELASVIQFVYHDVLSQ